MNQTDWIPGNGWTWPIFWMGIGVFVIFSLVIGLTAMVVRLRLRNDQKAREWQSRENRWNLYLDAVLSGEKPRQELLQQVQKNEGLYFVEYLYRRACRISERRQHNREYVELLDLAEPYLKYVAQRIHNKKLDPELRARSVATVGKLDPYRSLELLKYALEDPSDRVAFTAMRALVDHEDESCSELIARFFSRFQGYNPEYVASLLRRAHVGCAMGPLSQILCDESATLWSRVVAACTLEHWPAHAELVPALLSLGRDENQVPVLRALALRIISAWAFQTEARELIYEFAARDEQILRAHAMFAIGKLAMYSERNLLEMGLHDPARQVALEAAFAWEALEAGHKEEKGPRWYLQSLDLGDHLTQRDRNYSRRRFGKMLKAS